MANERKEKIITFLSKDPESSFLLFALAKEYESDGETEAAIATYIKLLDSNVGYTGAYYHLGKQYELLADNEKAIAIYKQGMVICHQHKALHDASELRGALDNLTMD